MNETDKINHDKRMDPTMGTGIIDWARSAKVEGGTPLTIERWPRPWGAVRPIELGAPREEHPPFNRRMVPTMGSGMTD